MKNPAHPTTVITLLFLVRALHLLLEKGASGAQLLVDRSKGIHFITWVRPFLVSSCLISIRESALGRILCLIVVGICTVMCTGQESDAQLHM